MMLKRISAATLPEALRKVETACGPDALVVETRRTQQGYVIVAARPPVAVPRPSPRAVCWTRGFAPLAKVAGRFGLRPKVLQVIERALVGTRVALDRPGDPALPGIAARVLGTLIPTRPLAPSACRVMAFLGPTGVGKTTTLAKLAARARRDEGEDVAIVTLDTYRVAAVEQLRAFADMIGVPIEVAFTPLDLRRAVARHSGRVFIDTTGRSPLDRDAIATLRGCLGPSRPTRLLCLAASSRFADAKRALSAFGEVDRLILTKWDETLFPGEALSLAIEQDLPISQVTVGQEVPGDIVEADAQELAACAFAPSLEHQAVLS